MDPPALGGSELQPLQHSQSIPLSDVPSHKHDSDVRNIETPDESHTPFGPSEWL